MITLRHLLTVLFLIAMLGYCQRIFPSDIKCQYNNTEIVLKDVSGHYTYMKKSSGRLYTYYINDIDNLSEIEDYVEIRNFESNIVFPLKCNKI